MNDNEKICIFTGHRAVPHACAARLKQLLEDTVEALYGEGVRIFCAGGAMGFDRMAADAVLGVRGRHPAVRLCLILPCRGQENLWSLSERRAYQSQVQAADEVICLAEHYYDGCMRVRNQALADRADICVAYVTDPRSGSYQTVRMASARGVPVINLAEKLPRVETPGL